MIEIKNIVALTETLAADTEIQIAINGIAN
jgi:hypothetical protein